MTRKEAIQALKMMNLVDAHPFLHWEEMLEVRDMAIAALQEQEERENPKPRKVQRYPDTKNVWTYYDPEMKNPCGCGSNCYHYEYDGQKIIGVCNGCGRDIYEVEPEYIQEYLDKGIWE